MQIDLKKVLVVDDDTNIQELIGVLLNKLGMSVVSAEGGETALNLLGTGEEGKFDLIVLDLMMPGCSGFDVLRQIREKNLADIPVVILTAKMIDDESLSLIETSPNVKRLWRKPFELNEIVHGIYAVLDAGRATV